MIFLLRADDVRLAAAQPPTSPHAADLGISHGHPDRQFTRVVGLNPRTLVRILRMRRLLEEVDVSRPAEWSTVAVQRGWFDQAHLIRDASYAEDLASRGHVVVGVNHPYQVTAVRLADGTVATYREPGPPATLDERRT